MKLYQLLFFCLLVIGCSEDETIEKFSIDIENKGTIQFDNSECEFNNRDNQTQFSTTFGFSQLYPREYKLGSFYSNRFDPDSIINTFSIDLIIHYEGYPNLRSDYLKSVLDSEDSYEKSNLLYPRVKIILCGEQFDNSPLGIASIGDPLFNDSFKYKINDFEIFYESECIDANLLFLDITMEGMFYSIEFGAPDSLYLNESKMKLLFDMDIQ